MEKNVGGIDRGGRIVIGVILAIIGIATFAGFLSVRAAFGAVALVVAFVLLVTAIAQTCPVNEAAGVDTTE